MTPRVSSFDPHNVTKGPGRYTKFQKARSVQGVYSDGVRFSEVDDWTRTNRSYSSGSRSWTGRTVFLVDKVFSNAFGTDQRHQRSSVRNSEGSRKVSWADMSDCDVTTD